MARLTPEEAQFIASLRRLVSRGGSLPTNLQDPELVPPAPPPVRPQAVAASVTEPRRGYWTGNLAFSRNFDGAYPISPGSQLLIEANELPGPPRGRGITLSRQDRFVVTSPAGLNYNYTIYADFEFGIGGNIQRARCDWQNCIVNLPGSIIRVNTTWAPNLPESVFPYNVGDGSTVEIGGYLGASVCSDPLVSKGYNTLTEYYPWSTAGVVDVPPFAIGFWLPINPTEVYTSTDVLKVLDNATVISQNVNPYIGDILTSQVQSNGLSVLNMLPASATGLDFTSSGMNDGSAQKLIWALEI